MQLLRMILVITSLFSMFYYTLCIGKIYKYGLYIMHDLSLILGCMRSVICFYEVDVVGNVFILF